MSKFFCSFTAVIMLSTAFVVSAAQQTMDNATVVKLHKAGLSEDLIIQTINASAGHYDTTSDAMIALKQAGVTDKEVSAMLAKNASANPTSSTADTPPAAVTSPSTPATFDKIIPKDSKVYVVPMNGFESYLISALDKKEVPVVVVTDPSNADFIITGNADSQKAGWAKTLATGSSQSTEEASINVTNKKSGSVVFAYNVNKGNSFHGKQSSAEACAKHLKEKIESGK
jgi:hypothetical protein